MTEVVDDSYTLGLHVVSKSYINRPALSGDSITFQCCSGLVLVGSSSSMCTDDGQWLPHPWELKCVNMSESTTTSCKWNRACIMMVTVMPFYFHGPGRPMYCNYNNYTR